MSYTIDIYRKHAKPATDFLSFACYVSMFPQLVAGPIVRYSDIANQLKERIHSTGTFVYGFSRFNYGFAKKILLANPVGEVADLLGKCVPDIWTRKRGLESALHPFSANQIARLGIRRLTDGFNTRAGEVLRQSKLGTVCNNMLQNRQIIPTKLKLTLARNAMAASGNDKFVVDGFPRAIDQLRAWQAEFGAPEPAR